jgi:hypothetical protein
VIIAAAFLRHDQSDSMINSLLQSYCTLEKADSIMKQVIGAKGTMQLETDVDFSVDWSNMGESSEKNSLVIYQH